MADSNFTTQAQDDLFDKATLKLDGAKSLISAMGILLGDAAVGHGSIPITGSLLNSAMSGIDCLIESAIDDLLTDHKSKAQA